MSITSLYSFFVLDSLPTVKTGQLCNVFCIVGGIRLFTSCSGLYSAFLSHFIGRLNSRYSISVSSLHRKFVAARHVTQSKHCHPILSPIHCNLKLELDTFVIFPLSCTPGSLRMQSFVCSCYDCKASLPKGQIVGDSPIVAFLGSMLLCCYTCRGRRIIMRMILNINILLPESVRKFTGSRPGPRWLALNVDVIFDSHYYQQLLSIFGVHHFYHYFLFLSFSILYDLCMTFYEC